MRAPTLDETVRRRVAAWMTARGLSQTALADAIGQNQPWVNRYLKGTLKADLETLARIAAAFDVPLSTLLDVPPPKSDAWLLEVYRGLMPKEQQLVRGFMSKLAPPVRKEA